MLRSAFACLLIVSLLVGCAEQREAASLDYMAMAPEPKATAPLASRQMVQLEAIDSADNVTAEPGSPSPTADRKIIYTAHLDLEVKDFQKLRGQIEALVNTHRGFVANYCEDKISGSQLAGNWTVRVPVEQFEAFLAAARELGIPQSQQVHGQDMTEEYVDLEARLSTKRKLEGRLTEIMQDRQADLNHLLQVEKELARVREEIERTEGRLRWLTDRVTLTTVTIRATERYDYEPPQITLGDHVENTWSGSWLALGRTVRFAMLSLIGFIPWALCLGLVSVPAAYLLKQRRPRGVC